MLTNAGIDVSKLHDVAIPDKKLAEQAVKKAEALKGSGRDLAELGLKGILQEIQYDRARKPQSDEDRKAQYDKVREILKNVGSTDKYDDTQLPDRQRAYDIVREVRSGRTFDEAMVGQKTQPKPSPLDGVARKIRHPFVVNRDSFLRKRNR
jgi:hypothetical protein